MGIISKLKEKRKGDDPDEKSIYVQDVRIDKKGVSWQRKALWIREEHLGKLKVIAHFGDKSLQDVLDCAIGTYIEEHWSKTGALEKLVKESPTKPPEA